VLIVLKIKFLPQNIFPDNDFRRIFNMNYLCWYCRDRVKYEDEDNGPRSRGNHYTSLPNQKNGKTESDKNKTEQVKQRGREKLEQNGTPSKREDLKQNDPTNTANATNPPQKSKTHHSLHSKKDFLALAKALCLSVAYGAYCGGIATITGTPPNLVLKDVADKYVWTQLQRWLSGKAFAP